MNEKNAVTQQRTTPGPCEAAIGKAPCPCCAETIGSHYTDGMGTPVEHVARSQDEAMAACLAALEALHDAIDEFNAGSDKDDDPRHTLCWLCGAASYGPELGVEHRADCAILAARKVLAKARAGSEVT